MPDRTDPEETPDAPPERDGEINDTPTITCERCDREWDASYELDELGVGNQALEQFALDHKRHTGHFPDGVETWRAVCRRCPEAAERLSESGAYRWGKTHARHTRHEVEIRHATDDETTILDGTRRE